MKNKLNNTHILESLCTRVSSDCKLIILLFEIQNKRVLSGLYSTLVYLREYIYYIIISLVLKEAMPIHNTSDRI